MSSHSRRPGRAGFAAATGLLFASTSFLLSVVTAGPASAAEPPFAQAYLHATRVSVGIGESTPGKAAFIHVYTDPGDNLPDHLTVKVDAGAAAGVVVLQVTGGDCTVADLVTTCQVPVQGTLRKSGQLPVTLKAANGAAVGAHGEISLTVSGAGVRTVTRTDEVGVWKSGPDLGTVPDFWFTDVKAGDVLSYRPSFRNNGDAIAKWVRLRLPGNRYFSPVTRFSNCQYAEAGPSVSYCEFELNLKPGESAQVSAETPVQLKVSDDMADRWWESPAYDVETGTKSWNLNWKPGNGPQLKLDRTAATTPIEPVDSDGLDIDWNDTRGGLLIDTGPHPGDLAAIGANVTGSADSVVPVRVGIHNNGPAWVMGVVDGDDVDVRWRSFFDPRQPSVRITFPEGVTVVEMPQMGVNVEPACYPMVNDKPDYARIGEPYGLDYYCTASDIIEAGGDWLFEFKVKVGTSEPVSGKAVVSGGTNDPDTSNNSAAITFNSPVTTPTGTVSPTASSSSGTGTPTPAASASRSTSASPLALTGTNVAMIGVVGLAVVAAGVLLMFLARRRRARFTAEE